MLGRRDLVCQDIAVGDVVRVEGCFTVDPINCMLIALVSVEVDLVRVVVAVESTMLDAGDAVEAQWNYLTGIAKRQQQGRQEFECFHFCMTF